MKKNKTKLVCLECGHVTVKWQGKCPVCNSWNSFEEQELKDNNVDVSLRDKVKHINQIEINKFIRNKVGVDEIDRVLGGGLVPSSVTLLGGEPGVGKSTLILEICKSILIHKDKKILYVSGEESEAQVAERAKRLNIKSCDFYILNECNWKNMKEVLKSLKPDIFIMDSIQTTRSSDLQGGAGSPTQIKETVNELVSFSKENAVTSLIIGHITKEGGFAGPKLLEHMVDTVLYIEKNRDNDYRFLRCHKNRFGTTEEIGIFEMSTIGLKQIKDLNKTALKSSFSNDYGQCVTCILEGSRSIIIELQALVVENKFSMGKRVTEGIDLSRLSLLMALIEKYFSIPVSCSDIYLNVLRGIKIKDRSCDLAIINTVLSSYWKKPISEESIFIGEVGLNGRIISASNLDKRLNQIQQLGYKKVYLDMESAQRYEKLYNIDLVGLNKVTDFIKIYEDKGQEILA